MSKNILVGIDIGTTKIFTVIAKLAKDKSSFKILGHGFSKSNGISKGVVVDVEEATFSIEKSIKEAEKMAGVKVQSALVGISGNHIESVTTHATVTVSKYPREITLNDKNKLEELIEGKIIKLDRHIIHKIAYNYRIDDGNIVKNPIGMVGCKLDADVHIITGIVNSIESLVKCVKSLNVNVEGIALEALVSAKSVLTDTEKKMGSVLVDIGGGTTDIAVLKNDKLIYTDVLPIGGEHFTHDIATILNIDLTTAEYLKRNLKNFLQSGDKDFIEVSTYKTSTPKKVSLSYLNSIIESRIEDITEHITKSISKSKYMNILRSGIIITGGASKTIGLKEKVENAFKIPTRIGIPSLEEKIPDELRTPEAATGIGLLLYSLDKNEQNTFKRETSNNRKGIFGSIKEKLKALIDSFLE